MRSKIERRTLLEDLGLVVGALGSGFGGFCYSPGDERNMG
jgi:hypothetical protein